MSALTVCGQQAGFFFVMLPYRFLCYFLLIITVDTVSSHVVNNLSEFCSLGVADGDALSRLSPVLEQLDILEIQQTAIRQLATEQEATAGANVMTKSPETVTRVQEAKANTTQSTVTTTDADDSDSEAEHEEAAATDTTEDLPKPAGNPVTSAADNKKGKVSLVICNICRY
jgi:hypothetical protein